MRRPKPSPIGELIDVAFDVVGGPEVTTTRDQLARALGVSRGRLEEVLLARDFPRKTSEGWRMSEVRAWFCGPRAAP